MLKIQPHPTSPSTQETDKPASNPKHTINLLPARLSHNGPIDTAQRYWNPQSDEKVQKTAYFRGRKLVAKTVPLPTNYTGAVLQVTSEIDRSSSSNPNAHAHMAMYGEDEDEDEDGDENVETKIVRTVGQFDELLVWQHGGMVSGTDDPYVRGVEEWIGFAEAMHGDTETEKSEGKTS